MAGYFAPPFMKVRGPGAPAVLGASTACRDCGLVWAFARKPELNEFFDNHVASLNPGGRLPAQACLLCRSDSTVFGMLCPASETTRAGVFMPDGIPWYRFVWGSIAMSDRAYACRDCAAVSTDLDRAELNAFVDKYCRPRP